MHYKICNYIYIYISLSQNARKLQGLCSKHTSVSEHQYASTHNQPKTLTSYTPTNGISLIIFIVLPKKPIWYSTTVLYLGGGGRGYICSHTTMEWLACSMHVVFQAGEIRSKENILLQRAHWHRDMRKPAPSTVGQNIPAISTTNGKQFKIGTETMFLTFLVNYLKKTGEIL